MCAKEEPDLDHLHELEAVVVNELLSGSCWVGQLIHNPSCQLQNPNDSLLQYQSVKTKTPTSNREEKIGPIKFSNGNPTN